jgi:hypothetical protein
MMSYARLGSRWNGKTTPWRKSGSAADSNGVGVALYTVAIMVEQGAAPDRYYAALHSRR